MENHHSSYNHVRELPRKDDDFRGHMKYDRKLLNRIVQDTGCIVGDTVQRDKQKGTLKFFY
jgi:hypothetical protein